MGARKSTSLKLKLKLKRRCAIFVYCMVFPLGLPLSIAVCPSVHERKDRERSSWSSSRTDFKVKRRHRWGVLFRQKCFVSTTQEWTVWAEIRWKCSAAYNEMFIRIQRTVPFLLNWKGQGSRSKCTVTGRYHLRLVHMSRTELNWTCSDMRPSVLFNLVRACERAFRLMTFCAYDKVLIVFASKCGRHKKSVCDCVS